MKTVAALTLLLASTQAFTNNNMGVAKTSVSLFMAEDTAAPTKNMDRTVVRKSISKMTAENFESTLQEIQPFLTTDAGLTFYSKSIRRIGNKAKELGVDMPADYAVEAKATEKRREKQNAFIQQKNEEAAAAAAEAAEAKAAEEAAAAEEEAAAPEEAESVTEEAAEEQPEPVES